MISDLIFLINLNSQMILMQPVACFVVYCPPKNANLKIKIFEENAEKSLAHSSSHKSFELPKPRSNTTLSVNKKLLGLLEIFLKTNLLSD